MLHLLIRKSPNPMITTAEPQATASGLQVICLQLRCDEHGTAGGHGRRHRRIGVSQAQFHRDYLCRDTATVSRFAVLHVVDGQRHYSGPRDGTISGDGRPSSSATRPPPSALRLWACFCDVSYLLAVNSGSAQTVLHCLLIIIPTHRRLGFLQSSLVICPG